MKILCIGDVEEKALWDYYTPSRTEGVDLIISCGDLKPAYLEFLVTMVNRPLLYVHGNHDEIYDTKAPEGCESIDGRLVTYGGLRIMGMGGSMRYKTGPHMETEASMARKIRRMQRQIRRAGGVDLFVTHAPALGYGDREDIAHRGFACFDDFLDRWKPACMIFAHVHQNYGEFERCLAHPSGTRIVNVSGQYRLEM